MHIREILQRMIILNMSMCLPTLFKDKTNSNALITIHNIREKLDSGLLKPSEVSDEILISVKLLRVYEELE